MQSLRTTRKATTELLLYVLLLLGFWENDFCRTQNGGSKNDKREPGAVPQH
jgi:hypothetical protein